MESYKKSFKLGDKEITLESGKVARQATGAVIATCDDTQVLATVVVGKAPGEHQDFFPANCKLSRENLCYRKNSWRVFQERRKTNRKRNPNIKVNR